MSTTMLTGRLTYKPIRYQWAYDLWHAHESIHWTPDELNFEQDVRDWNFKLPEEEKKFITQLLRFFTQADVQVNAGYSGIFLPVFHKTPELNLICSSIANREATHVVAYSRLNDTINMPDSEYDAFMSYHEMKEKYEYVADFGNETPEQLAYSCAVYGAFVEGIQLFSSFAMLMNFDRFGKMPAMVDVARWSQRDEKYHCDFLIQSFLTLLSEFPEIDTVGFRKRIVEIGMKMVELEKHFIDLAFAEGAPEGLTREQMHQYVEYLANVRFQQLGFPKIYATSKNPLPWVDVIVSGKEHANFFERRSTEYSKGKIQGSLDDDDFDDIF